MIRFNKMDRIVNRTWPNEIRRGVGFPSDGNDRREKRGGEGSKRSTMRLTHAITLGSVEERKPRLERLLRGPGHLFPPLPSPLPPLLALTSTDPFIMPRSWSSSARHRRPSGGGRPRRPTWAGGRGRGHLVARPPLPSPPSDKGEPFLQRHASNSTQPN